MGDLFIPRKELLLPPDELDRALRTDFLTIERWANHQTSTRIILPDSGAPLSGDVSVIPGNNVGILRDGNGFLIYANPPSARRALSVFAPGAAAARTLMKATIPSPVLQAIDVFILTAATGADALNHSNVIVEGTTSGSVTLPITSGLQEWHLGPGDIGVPLGSERIPVVATHSGQVSAGASAVNFTPSADLVVFNLDSLWALAGPTVGSTNPRAVRVGIAAVGGVVNGNTPTLTDPSGLGNGWVLGQDGLSLAYVDVDTATIAPGTRWSSALPGAAGFKLLQGNTYAFTVMHKNTAAVNAIVNTDFGVPTPWASTVQGNITQVGVAKATNSDNGNGHGVFGTWSDTQNGGDFSLLGSIVGVMLTGLVQVRQTITGAPTTPGTDMNIYVQC